MMDVNKTYYSNHFKYMYVIILYTLNLYNVLYQVQLNKTKTSKQIKDKAIT